jgi:hypothetical protein
MINVVVEWIYLAHSKGQWQVGVQKEMKFRVSKGREFID